MFCCCSLFFNLSGYPLYAWTLLLWCHANYSFRAFLLIGTDFAFCFDFYYFLFQYCIYIPSLFSLLLLCFPYWLAIEISILFFLDVPTVFYASSFFSFVLLHRSKLCCLFSIVLVFSKRVVLFVSSSVARSMCSFTTSWS